MQSNAEVAHSLVVLRLQAAPRGSSGPLDAMIRVENIGGKKHPLNLGEVEVADFAMCPCPQDSRLAPSSSCIGIRINLPRIGCSHVKLAHVFELGKRAERERTWVSNRQVLLKQLPQKKQQDFSDMMKNPNLRPIFWV
jgi:hypothetical protein